MHLQCKYGYCMTTQTLHIALCKRDGIIDGWTDGRVIQFLEASIKITAWKTNNTKNSFEAIYPTNIHSQTLFQSMEFLVEENQTNSSFLAGKLLLAYAHYVLSTL